MTEGYWVYPQIRLRTSNWGHRLHCACRSPLVTASQVFSLGFRYIALMSLLPELAQSRWSPARIERINALIYIMRRDISLNFCLRVPLSEHAYVLIRYSITPHLYFDEICS